MARMDIFSAEGIVLHAWPFQDYDQILTVFSAEEGLMKFIVKRAYLSKKGNGAAASPLTRAEFVYTKRKSELLACQEISVLNRHLQLRQDIRHLEASCDMLQAVLTSQWPGKPAPDLYRLLQVYLEKITEVPDPFAVSSSFRMKVLKHEGLLRMEDSCAECRQQLKEGLFLSAGESFCTSHAPLYSLPFSQAEFLTLEALFSCRQFSQLAGLQLSPTLISQIKHLFQGLV